MKNSKWLIAAIAALVVIAVILLVVIIGIKPGKGDNTPSNPSANQQQEPTADYPTLEGEMSMVENVFDDETLPSTNPEETQSAAKPTEPDETTEPTKPGETEEPGATEPTVPSDTKPEKPTQGPTEPEEPEQPTAPAEEMTYERFKNLTPAQQRAYQESYEDIADFFEWYNSAKAEYEAAHPPIIVGPGGSVDFDDIPGN